MNYFYTRLPHDGKQGKIRLGVQNTLVPTDNLSLSPDKRRLYKTTKIYVPFGLNIY